MMLPLKIIALETLQLSIFALQPNSCHNSIFVLPCSNVVEKCIVHASRHERSGLIDELCSAPER